MQGSKKDNNSKPRCLSSRGQHSNESCWGCLIFGRLVLPGRLMLIDDSAGTIRSSGRSTGHSEIIHLAEKRPPRTRDHATGQKPSRRTCPRSLPAICPVFVDRVRYDPIKQVARRWAYRALLRGARSGNDRLGTRVQGLSWAAGRVAQALLPVSMV